MTTATPTTSTTSVTWTDETIRDAIYGVSSRLPPFWINNPEAWFIQAEAQFTLSRITTSSTMYSHVVAQLPPDVISKTIDCLKAANAAENKYETLKDLLLKRLGISEEKRISNLLYHEQMGDQSPSEFYHRLESLSGTSEEEKKIMVKLFVDRLPPPLDSTAIQLKQQGPDVYLPVLDNIWEKIHSKRPTVNAIQSSLEQKLDLLINRIEKLESRNSNRGRSPSRTNSHARSNSKSKSHKYKQNRSKTPQDGICHFHRKFGKEARNCTSWCKFATKPNPAKSGNE